MKSKYLNRERGRNFLVIGAGGTLLTHKHIIQKVIDEKDPVIIGINNMTSMWIPHYHLWTNNSRLKKFKSCIHHSSVKMFGIGIKEKFGKYIIIDYIDTPKTPLKYKNNKIYGHFRTAGCLAVMIAHLMGAKYIYIAGMDGYTLNKEQQHCYGSGMTDGDLKNGRKKDKLVNLSLKNLRKYGITFNIITPTIFNEFRKEYK